jgi:F-type H+-transporting ATPase subunit a
MEAHGFNWVSIIPVLQDLPPHVAFGIIIFATLAMMAVAVSRKMAAPEKYLVPERSLTLRNAVEMAVAAILKLIHDTMGEHGKHFLPLLGSLAFFIFFSNISGQIPGFLPPTDNLNTTAACALVVFFTTHIYGFKVNGMSYLKHFVGPVWWLAPLMIPIEIIGHLARPLSLSMRLFGNIFGDHMVLSVFVLLVPLIVPLPMMFLGIFVAIVQTFVFTLLSMIYISGAIEHHEEHH